MISQGDQGRPVSSLTGPNQFIRIYASQSSCRNTKAIPRSGKVELNHQAVLQYILICYKGKTKWQWLEKDIITGDTISVILFSSAMNLMVRSAEKECKGPVMKTVIR